MQRNAFSLVELLVVIAIISTLAAILMPTLQQSLQAAKSIRCLNNLRQMGFATANYAANSNGWLLYSRVQFSEVTYASLGMLGRYHGSNNLAGLLNTMLIDQYIPYPKASIISWGDYGLNFPYQEPLFCPSWYTINFYNWQHEWTYGQRTSGLHKIDSAPIVRRYVITYPSTYVSTSRSTLPASKYLIWGDSIVQASNWGPNCYSQISFINEGTTDYTNAYQPMTRIDMGSLHLRHSAGGNAWFADGHGENIPLEKVINDKLGIRAFADASVPGVR